MAYRKKLIIWDSTVRRPNNASTGIKAMVAKYERAPFDGLVLDTYFSHETYESSPTLQTFSNWWTSGHKISWNSCATCLGDLQTIDWRYFSDNFIHLKFTSAATGYGCFDWYANSRNSLVWNIRMAARLAKAGYLRGIVLDCEPISTAGFKVFCHADRPYSATYSFAQYILKVRETAQWIMEAIQDEFPNIHLIVSFSYEQAIKQHNPPIAADNYGLLVPFLDGLQDSRTGSAEIHNYYEDGYPHYLAADINYDLSVQSSLDSNALTKRWNMGKGKASRVDDLTSAHLAAGITGGISITDKYGFVYDDAHMFMADPPTMTEAEHAAVEAARVTIGWEPAFSSTIVPNGIMDLNAATYVGADNDPVSTYTDVYGIVYTQAGGNRPVYKNPSAIGAGIPGFLFTAASSQNFVCDALVTALHAAYPAQDLPFALFILLKLTAAGAGYTYLGFGRDATTNSYMEFENSSGNLWQYKGNDDAAASAVASSNTNSDTAVHVVSFISDGTYIYMRVDGQNVLLTNPYFSIDIGNMTMNRARVGSNARNSIGGYMGGTIGRMILYPYAVGMGDARTIEKNLCIQGGIRNNFLNL